MVAESGDEAFATDFGKRDFNFRSLGGGDEFLFEIAEAAFLILTNEFADVLAGRAPITRSDLAFDVLFQGFGERDIQLGHGHGFII